MNLSKSVIDIIRRNNYFEKELCFLCVGTDKVVGDAVGPLVGSNLKKYIDTGKMEHYSSATEGIRLIPTYLSMIDEERTAYLEQAGFSDKEISEITAE